MTSRSRAGFTWAALLLAACAQNPAVESAAELGLPAPTPVQLGWQQAELGVVFHYDLHVLKEGRYHQPTNRVTPILDTSFFAPEQLDTNQWVRAAKAAGAAVAARGRGPPFLHLHVEPRGARVSLLRVASPLAQPSPGARGAHQQPPPGRGRPGSFAFFDAAGARRRAQQRLEG